MEVTDSGVPVHYAEYGSGTPVLALHGAGSDHREITGALEPIFSTAPGFRRLHPDLPGMGHTPAPRTITSNDDVLDIRLGLIGSTIGTAPATLCFTSSQTSRRPSWPNGSRAFGNARRHDKFCRCGFLKQDRFATLEA